MKTFSLFGFVLAGCLSGFFPIVECRADTTFFDGTFSNSDWSEVLYVNGNGGSSSAAQTASGGNPGSFYQVTTSVNPGPACGAGVYLRNGFTYSPSTQGAIYNLDYSVDLIAISLYGEAEPVVSQNGNIYFGPELYTTAGTWQTLTETNLMAADFARLITGTPNGELGADGTSHPDFSTNGSPITFGFIVPDSSMTTPYTTIGGVDNYTLTVHVDGLLKISLANGITALSWLATTNSYTLESTPALVPPAWSVVTNVPALSGEFYAVTNVWTNTALFFRLQKD
jgi:hypothetical protein